MKTKVLLIFLACASGLSWAQTSPASSQNASNRFSQESRIPAGTASLYSREIGQGTPIIVLHGGPDFDHSYLLPELDRLSDSFRLIYYDQRGRGRSADHVQPEDVTLDSEVADLDRVREHFHLASMVLLGHSWGAVLALEYALRHPERVSRMILMNPAPASSKDREQLRKDWLDKRAKDMEQRRVIAETAAYKSGDPDAVTAYYRVHFKPALAREADYEKLIARLKASFGKEGILKARAIEDRLMTETWAKPDYDLLPKLKKLNIPTLVISGDHEFIPSATAEHISQALPHARMVILKNCGHFTYLECPTAVHESLNTFFRGK